MISWKTVRLLLWAGLLIGLIGIIKQLAASPASVTAVADQIHLAWTEDPAVTLTVVWHTTDAAVPSTVQYRPLGDMNWQTTNGALRPSGTSGALHETTLSGLTPATVYEYRVAGDGGTWSDVYAARTAPHTGSPASFDVVYVADTGIIGRDDGLATGTAQVIDEIADMQPLLLLPGGDYAYFNTDGRFPTLDQAIDAWFNQMQPLAATMPFMPTYGNHEVVPSLLENFEAWRARFPTPGGLNNAAQFYSFDVAHVHFISLFVPEAPLPAAAITWLEQDIQAAQAAGQTWIIPYFHVSAFADGDNHPSSLPLRNQLGPLFENLGIRLVISSHDQAYERTYPLLDVPATNSPATLRRACLDGSGVTWVKVSPGGKLSSINWDFSQFTTVPAPQWTAVRDNSLHHFLRLRFGGDGSLVVQGYGVTGDGTPPVLVDRFAYQPTCSPELLASEPVLSLKLAYDDASITRTLTISSSDGLPVVPVLSSDQPWVTAVPITTSTPVSATLTIDPAALPPGQHTATLLATAASYEPARVLVTLLVRGNTGPYQLLVSKLPDRSAAHPLHNREVAGNIYVFTAPDDATIGQVRFFVDDVRWRRESGAPYDLMGTEGSLALPFDTATLVEGAHVVTAVIVANDGSTETASAVFQVQNTTTPQWGIWLPLIIR